MKITQLDLKGVFLIEPDVHRDARGFFLESYHQKKYAAAGISERFVQDNHSKSGMGTLRGLHAQMKNPQGKLVRVLQGEIYDVAVDIRRGSPTFGKWAGDTLSAENFRQLYIPPGFAHGFCVTSQEAQVEYKCTNFYDPADEVQILWSDARIGIKWPVQDPILSPKDRGAKTLKELEPLLGFL